MNVDDLFCECALAYKDMLYYANITRRYEQRGRARSYVHISFPKGKTSKTDAVCWLPISLEMALFDSYLYILYICYSISLNIIMKNMQMQNNNNTINVYSQCFDHWFLCVFVFKFGLLVSKCYEHQKQIESQIVDICSFYQGLFGGTGTIEKYYLNFSQYCLIAPTRNL